MSCFEVRWRRRSVGKEDDQALDLIVCYPQRSVFKPNWCDSGSTPWSLSQSDMFFADAEGLSVRGARTHEARFSRSLPPSISARIFAVSQALFPRCSERLIMMWFLKAPIEQIVLWQLRTIRAGTRKFQPHWKAPTQPPVGIGT